MLPALNARAAVWRIVPVRCAALAVVLGEIGQHFVAQTNEAGIVTLAWTRQSDIDDPFDAARPWRHRDDAVAEVKRFVDVVRDENHRDAFVFPDALQLVLQAAARERIERAERLVEQQHARTVHEAARNRHALRHAARQLMRIRIFKAVQADERDVLRDRIALFARR